MNQQMHHSIAPARKLLDQVRDVLRSRHYSIRTEKAYVDWIRRYIFFHGKRHPRDLGAPQLEEFLTALAVERHVAASTQNQALAALLFLYRDVLGMELPWLDDVTRAKRPRRLPVVLSRDEVREVLARCSGSTWRADTVRSICRMRLRANTPERRGSRGGSTSFRLPRAARISAAESCAGIT